MASFQQRQQPAAGGRHQRHHERHRREHLAGGLRRGPSRLGADGKTWKVWTTLNSSLPNAYVGALAVAPDGTVWAACDPMVQKYELFAGGLVHLLPDGKDILIRGGREDDIVHFMEFDRSGRLWALTGGQIAAQSPGRGYGERMGPRRFHGRIQTFDGQKWTPWADVHKAVEAWHPQRPVRTRLGWAVEGEKVWLMVKRPDPQVQANPATGLPGLTMAGMPPGLGAGLGSFGCFMSLPNEELTCYDGNGWAQPVEPPPDRPGELVVDGKGNKWLSLETLGDIVLGAGVACLPAGASDGEWRVHDRRSGVLPTDAIQSLTVDAAGRLWAADHMGDLYRREGEQWTAFPRSITGNGDFALSRAHVDGKGRLWFPSRGGVLVYEE